MKTMSRTQNSMLNLISSFAIEIVQIILKFIVRTVFIHQLGKQYLGINGLFTNILSLLAITELGFDTAMNFKLYKPIADDNHKQIRILMKFYKITYRVIGTVILLLGLSLIPLLPHLIKDYSTLEELGLNPVLIYVLYLMQSVSTYLFFAYRSAIVKAHQKTYYLNIANCIVTTICQIVNIVVLMYTSNFVLYTSVTLIFNIITNLVYAIIATKMFPHYFVKENDNINKEEAKDMFKDCGSLFFSKINTALLKATDNIVLSIFIGLSIVGSYSNYLLIYNTIDSILKKFFVSIKASLGNYYATESKEKFYFFFKVINFMTIVLYGTACVGVVLLIDDFIYLWIGKEYLISNPISLLIGMELLFSGISATLQHVRNVSGLFRQMWYRPLVGSFVNIIVSVVLCKFIGIYGVIIGTIATYIFTNFMMDPKIIFKQVFTGIASTSEYYIDQLKYFLCIVIIGLIDWYICGIELPFSNIINFGIRGVFCTVSVPLFMIIIFKNNDECKYFVKKIASILIKLKKIIK